eukprot:COSAG05_NODE_684_length_7947_cov_117.612603_7_plen_74_part_00
MNPQNTASVKKETRKCQHCGGTLRVIGRQRKNGKPSYTGHSFDDWSQRKYHKKCYREVKELEQYGYGVKQSKN